MGGQLTAKESADELASNETLNYILDLEKEVERLKAQVKTINSELHSSKASGALVSSSLLRQSTAAKCSAIAAASMCSNNISLTLCQ